MSGCVNRCPFCITQLTALALILLTVSGCALFNSGSSLSSLIETAAVEANSGEPAEGAGDPANADVVTAAEHPESAQRDEAAAVDQPPAPAARLLNPDFSRPAPSTTDNSSGGHSLSAAAVSSSGDRSPTKFHLASQARPLFDGPEAPPAPVVSTEPRSVEATPISQSESGPAHSIPSSVDRPAAATSGDVPSGSERAEQPQEQKLLDRLRRFRPDRSPRVLLGRPFDRVPNPLQWDWFGGKENGEPSPPLPGPDVSMPQPPAAGEGEGELIGSDADTSELLTALITSQEQDLNAWPLTENGAPLQPNEYRRRQLNLRLLRLISDQPAAAAEAIDSMSPAEQKFWQELMMAISRFRNPGDDASYGEHIAATVGQFNTAVRQLEPLSTLSIRRLDFCSRISDFGSIETFPANTFEPGQRLLIYAEVDNPQSEVTSSGYQTAFGGTLQIWSAASDVPIESLELPVTSYESSTRRLDYYLSYEFTLPAHLPAGEYEIQLQISDEISSRTANARLSFSVQ